MNFRPFDPKRDKKAARRIWEETGWIDRDEDAAAKYLDLFLGASKTLVADIDQVAECIVSTAPGCMRHLENNLSLTIVAGVTTSLIARKQGFASRLTAELIAQDAQLGSELAALGMFEQGYYSRLGFGTGPYEHRVIFDPSQLRISSDPKIPQRLTLDDYHDVHFALINRWRTHGSVNVIPPEHVQAEMGWTKDALGLGYRNSEGDLTHFVWGESKGEHGPFEISTLAYQNREQLLELLAMLKALGDQIYAVSMLEPCHLQLQDLLQTPLRRQITTEGSEFEESNSAEAFWQVRINNLESVLSKTHLPGRSNLAFNLDLTDPISKYLAEDSSWRGIGGKYTILLGEFCSAEQGHQAGLPLLRASVGGFSRLWLGCASATAISLAGEIEASQQLLDKLHQTLCLPLPKTGWEF